MIIPKCLNVIVNKTIALLALCVLFSLSSSCGKQSNVEIPVVEDYITHDVVEKRTNLKLGVVSGPYGDMFVETILPLFSQKGYEVELVLYDNFTEPNFALDRGDIDLNMFQNYEYLNSFKFENDLNISAISEIPTASMGIYSLRYDELDELNSDNITIALPNDSTNLSRALHTLSDAGIITINPSINSRRVSLDHIVKNRLNAEFVPIASHLLTKRLFLYDLAVINGNFAINAGLDSSDLLFSENLDYRYLNVIAVRTEDLSEPFVLDLVNILRLDEYKDKIRDVDGKYTNFQYPLNFAINE